MAFCRYCGNKLNDGDTVCANCGNEVKPPVWQTQQQNTPYLQQTQEPRSIGISKPSGNKKKPIIIIVILVVIAIIVGIVLVFFAGKDKDKDESSSGSEYDYNEMAKEIYDVATTYCNKQEINGNPISAGFHYSDDKDDFSKYVNDESSTENKKWCVVIIDGSPTNVFVYDSVSYVSKYGEKTNADAVFMATDTYCTKQETAGNPVESGLYGSWQSIDKEDKNETDDLFEKTPKEERSEIVDKINDQISDNKPDYNWAVFISNGEPFVAFEYIGVYNDSRYSY